MTPTCEQQEIIDFAKSDTRSILINASAGAAKTTTLCLVANALPATPMLCLAFNKSIAEEMAERLPSNCLARTINSIGHRAWGAATGRRLTINTRKSYEILKSNIETHLKGQDREAAYDDFGDTLKIIGAAKREGYIPSRAPSGRSLIEAEGFYDGLDEEPSPLQRSLIERTLCESIALSYSGVLDFDDQIYMPTLFGGSFPKFPLVLCDETQDLSPINHSMLQKLVVDRFIGVGDPYQSIYGFRGAVQQGMAHLRERFSCAEFPLSISFRCPEAIVRRAQFRVPHMRWAKAGGRAEILKGLHARDIASEAVILCRNNAPLFSLAISLLASGRGCTMIGSDLGPNLIKVLKKLGPISMPRKEVIECIDLWEAEKLERAKDKGAVADKAECLRTFADYGATLSDAIAYCESIFTLKGTITLSTIHKAKGLEWDTVYHLDPWRIPSRYAQTDEAMDQELNLRYVCITRSKDTYFEINCEHIERNGHANERVASCVS